MVTNSKSGVPCLPSLPVRLLVSLSACPLWLPSHLAYGLTRFPSPSSLLACPPHVLHLSTSALCFTFCLQSGWFADVEKHKQFIVRLKYLTSVVCCVDTNPGWIW